MRVELKLHKLAGGYTDGGSAKVFRDGGPKTYKESTFWFKVKQTLQEMGYDVIAKRMWKDGHLVDDSQIYVRSRKYTPDSFMIYQTDYAIRSVYEGYNKNGEVDLGVDGAMFERE